MNWRTDWAFLVPIILILTIFNFVQIESEQMKIAMLGIIGAVITVTSSVYGIVLSNRLSKERELNLKQFEMKATTYVDFFEIMTKMVSGVKNDNFDVNTIGMDFLSFKSKIIAWGNEDAIKIIKRMDEGNDEEIDATKAVERFNSIILALRKDLGHRDSLKFKPFHLFINDLKECE